LVSGGIEPRLRAAVQTRYNRSVKPPSSINAFSSVANCRSNKLHATEINANAPFAVISE